MKNDIWEILLPELRVERVEVTEQNLHIETQTQQKGVSCPECGAVSSSVHSRYSRTIQDLPLSGYGLKIEVTVRRMRCRNVNCARQTFSEGVPSLAVAYGRRSERLKQALRVMALAISAESCKRLSQQLQMTTSGDTLLRLLRGIQLNNTENSGKLGVDDWAFKRGTRYGTLIIDLDRHRPVELLPDRTTETLRSWLAVRPDIEFLARDRSNEYARAMTEGAPQAIQVADRWHLLKNFREMLERALSHVRDTVKVVPCPSDTPTVSLVLRPQRLRKLSSVEQAVQVASRQSRQQRYEQVRYLAMRGLSERAIARYLGLSRATVRKFARAQTFPERVPKSLMPSILDPYLNYLEQRWLQGMTNAQQLWRELCSLGYTGSPRQVKRWATYRRSLHKNQNEQVVNFQPSSFPGMPPPRQVAWWLMAYPDQLTPEQSTTLAYLQQHPLFVTIYNFAQYFVIMVRNQIPERLTLFLQQCAQSDIPDFRFFGESLQRDFDAVLAALTYPYSNGPTEGHVNRLKFIKRSMYGRANFDLLRIRVLAPYCALHAKCG